MSERNMMLINILRRLGMKKEKEYCFKDQEKVIFVKNCSIADKQYALSGNPDNNEYLKAYKDAKEDDKKFFLMGCFTSSVLENEKWLEDYIFSIETIYQPTSNNYELTGVMQEFKNNQDNIWRKRVENINVFDVVFIRVRENGKETLDYLKYYMVSSDSRTYANAIYNMVQYIPETEYKDLKNETDLPHNLLVCGAPGTGKSSFIKKQLEEVGENIIDEMINFNTDNVDSNIKEATAKKQYLEKYTARVTFYEDYAYENFVGCYKPVPEMTKMSVECDNLTGSVQSERIAYKYVPGPFVEIYIKAINDLDHNYYLVIEEINRAKAASVFGDMFQLLDRDKGQSVYTIKPDADLNKYLEEELGKDKYYGTMSLPPNMYIWATMNSADQGVYALDSAFKRRWSYLYKDVNAEKDWGTETICLRVKGAVRSVYWDKFRGKINKIILGSRFEEDRCIGAGFFSEEEFKKIEKYMNENDPREKEKLTNPLVDKLFSYLLQDVFRMNKTALFKSEDITMSQLRTAMKGNFDINQILNIEIDAETDIKIDNDVDLNNEEKGDE